MKGDGNPEPILFELLHAILIEKGDSALELDQDLYI